MKEASKWNQLSFPLIILALALSILGNYFILKFFPSREVNPDLLMQIFPYHILIEYVSDILFLFCLFLFIFNYAIPNKKYIGSMINIVSLMYIFRALFMILTPMMRPTGVDLPSHGIFREATIQLGMFPSGHIGLLALLYFMIEGKTYNKMKQVYLISLFLAAFTMIISRGHYSIDVVGGIMLSYIIVHEYKRRSKFEPLQNVSQTMTEE